MHPLSSWEPAPPRASSTQSPPHSLAKTQRKRFRHPPCTTATLLTPVWLLGLPLTALQWSIKRKYNQLKQICHFHPCVSAQRTSWSIPDAAWSIQTTAQEQSFKFIILLPCDLQLSGLQRELVPQHGADSQDQPQPPPRCAATSQLQKKPPTYFHLQKPSRSLLENGLGGQAAYYLLSGKEPELSPKLSLLSIHMRMVIHPTLRQLG